VRSGQRLYATDLTCGRGRPRRRSHRSIHIYGGCAVVRSPVRAATPRHASIARSFQAELVAIAGQYRVFEEPVADLRGKPVQAWLDGDKLKLAASS
jgi:septum site-determining protein MinC